MRFLWYCTVRGYSYMDLSPTATIEPVTKEEVEQLCLLHASIRHLSSIFHREYSSLFRRILAGAPVEASARLLAIACLGESPSQCSSTKGPESSYELGLH
jgi:hypothetical protein